MKVTIDKEKKEMTIIIPLQEPVRPSASGKTMVVASTRGNTQADCEYDGHPITIGLNAYYKP